MLTLPLFAFLFPLFKIQFSDVPFGSFSLDLLILFAHLYHPWSKSIFSYKVCKLASLLLTEL